MKKLKSQLKIEKESFTDTSSGFCPVAFTDEKNEKVLEIVRKYLTPKDSERTLFGEVFTPLELVCEMLSHLPDDVWTNKNLKWLDPANGIGNFPIVVYYKLMETLKSVPEKNRSKHIIENMLYMNELNPVNVAICKIIFKMIDPTSNPHLSTADFLKMDCLKKLGIDKFDVIIGNPPYNSGGINAKTTKNVERDQTESETIWPIIVEKSLSLLRDENSYIVFIHPGSWIGLKSTNGDMITNKQILFLRFYNYHEANLLFGNKSGKIPLTYYVLQNQDTKNNTMIYDNVAGQAVSFNIYKSNFVPTESIQMLQKINEMTQKYGSLKSNHATCRNINDDDYTQRTSKYPVVGIADKQIDIKYSRKNYNKFTGAKLILANSSMGYPIIDRTGFAYPSSSDRCLLYSNIDKDKNELHKLQQLQSYLYTNLMLYIINITKTRQNFFDNKIFEIIPDITKITDINNITDELLIKLFKLDDADLVGYEEYKKTGEGRLDAETIQRFKQFNIYEASAATKIQAVARGKQTRNKKPKTTGGKTRRKRWF